MMNSSNNTLHHSATCPACGLLCDDVVVENQPTGIKVIKNACNKGVIFFERAQASVTPTINGKPATLQQAVAEAAKQLKQAKSPLFDGLSTDLTGFRAMYQLAQKSKAALKHINAASSTRNMRVLQSTGWQTTTLTEVKNRADLILCVGSDLVSHNPRFYERFIDIDGMFVTAKERRVIVLGEAQNHEPIKSNALQAAQRLACKTEDLPSIAIALRALVAGKQLKATAVAGISITQLQEIAEQLKAAKYAVIAWVAKDFNFPQAELTIQQLTETVAQLNLNSRAAGLALGGSDGDTSANYANTWLSGVILNDDSPTHDMVVWVNSFSSAQAPVTPNAQIILAARLPEGASPAVFIPIATPALDCNGMLFRVDGSVTLPLKKLRDTQNPTLSEVASQIEALL
jgi:formylmethanofuran dehydrogenase subunit B